MNTWSDMSQSATIAARLLRRYKNRRGDVSRADDAAFSAVTHELRKRTRDFASGYEHLSHIQMPRYIKKHLTCYSKQERQELILALRRLRQAFYDTVYLVDSLGAAS